MINSKHVKTPGKMTGHVSSAKGPRVFKRGKNNSCSQCFRLMKENIEDKALLHYVCGVLENNRLKRGEIEVLGDKISKYLTKDPK